MTQTTTIITLTTTRDQHLYTTHIHMLNSFLAYSQPDVHLIVIENNSGRNQFALQWREAVERAGQTWCYIGGPFHMNRFFNMATHLVDTPFVCYANSDLLFFPDWHTKLLGWFDVYPDLVCAFPYTACDSQWQRQAPQDSAIYRQGKSPEERFIFCGEIAGWFWCFRTSFMRSIGGWDEQFVVHYQDNDMFMRLRCGDHRFGVALNSRIDHLVNKSYAVLTPEEKQHFESGGDAFHQKWGNT